jgi:polyhydroxybutyrate depolymerase
VATAPARAAVATTGLAAAVTRVAAALALGVALAAGPAVEPASVGARRAGDAVVAPAVAPVPSAGCAADGVAPAGGARGAADIEPGVSVTSLRFRGAARAYVREVPSAPDGRHPLPLVVDLHGWGGGALATAGYTGLGRMGEARGFVTLTPQGAGDPPAWDAAVDGPDVAFVEALLDEAERSLCVDTRRVYVAGASNGAMLASTLACVGGGRIAAVAAVAGVSPVLPARGAPASQRCHPTRPVAVVAVHGTDDQVIRFRGGISPGVQSLPGPEGVPLGARQRPTALGVPEVMSVWARRGGCATDPRRPGPVAADVRRLAWRCPPGAAVELYVVQGGGHGWPGAHGLPGGAGLAPATAGLADTSRVVANKLIWAFFAAHPLAGGLPGRG